MADPAPPAAQDYKPLELVALATSMFGLAFYVAFAAFSHRQKHEERLRQDHDEL